jgi:hypothetical protein
MKEEIKKWLKDPVRSQKDGAALFEKYGRNRILMKLFNSKENANTLEKLSYELTKLAGIKETVKTTMENIPSISKEKQSQINNNLARITGVQPAALVSNPEPPKDADLERRRAKLFNDRARLSNKLKEQQTDADRKKIIDEIKVLEKEYYAVIDSIKHVETTGNLPEETEKPVKNSKYDIPATLELKMQALLNARSRKSKAIRKAKKLGDSPAGLKKQKEIAMEENFIKALEAALK